MFWQQGLIKNLLRHLGRLTLLAKTASMVILYQIFQVDDVCSQFKATVTEIYFSDSIFYNIFLKGVNIHYLI